MIDKYELLLLKQTMDDTICVLLLDSEDKPTWKPIQCDYMIFRLFTCFCY